MIHQEYGHILVSRRPALCDISLTSFLSGWVTHHTQEEPYLPNQFDLCDPDRHFALVVPQRARECPALLNAIYTASARHLCRLDQYKKDNVITYLDKCLPDLQMETAIEYHSRCVSVSDDPEAIYDENLLLASIILRFYEEVDGRFAQSHLAVKISLYQHP